MCLTARRAAAAGARRGDPRARHAGLAIDRATFPESQAPTLRPRWREPAGEEIANLRRTPRAWGEQARKQKGG